MKRVAIVIFLICSLSPLASADGGDAGSAAVRQVKAMAMRPAPSAPAPAQPREEWVSERRVWVTGLGVFAVVPGHWERRVSSTQSSVPSLTIFREADRAPLTVHGGERLPADLRSGP